MSQTVHMRTRAVATTAPAPVATNGSATTAAAADQVTNGERRQRHGAHLWARSRHLAAAPVRLVHMLGRLEKKTEEVAIELMHWKPLRRWCAIGIIMVMLMKLDAIGAITAAGRRWRQLIVDIGGLWLESSVEWLLGSTVQLIFRVVLGCVALLGTIEIVSGRLLSGLSTWRPHWPTHLSLSSTSLREHQDPIKGGMLVTVVLLCWYLALCPPSAWTLLISLWRSAMVSASGFLLCVSLFEENGWRYVPLSAICLCLSGAKSYRLLMTLDGLAAASHLSKYCRHLYFLHEAKRDFHQRVCQVMEMNSFHPAFVEETFERLVHHHLRSNMARRLAFGLQRALSFGTQSRMLRQNYERLQRHLSVAHPHWATLEEFSFEINRQDLLASSFRALKESTVQNLLADYLKVSFAGEMGQDEGGVMRDWFDTVGRKLSEEASGTPFTASQSSTLGVNGAGSIDNTDRQQVRQDPQDVPREHTVSQESASVGPDDAPNVEKSEVTEASWGGIFLDWINPLGYVPWSWLPYSQTEPAELAQECGIEETKPLQPLLVAQASSEVLEVRPGTARYEDFYALGRLLALAVIRGMRLPLHLSRASWKLLTRTPIEAGDVYAVDPVFFKNRIAAVLEPGGVKALSEILGEPLTFMSAETPLSPNSMELEPGGSNKLVTEENKVIYIEKLCEFYICGLVGKEWQLIVQGFEDLLPSDALREHGIKSQDVELLICGLPEIDVDDWQSNTALDGPLVGTEDGERLQRWFWDAMAHFGAERRAKLLQFATGSSRVPGEGFKGLDPPFCLYLSSGPATQLPTASTCTNQLNLVLYESRWDLIEKLKIVCHVSAEGFGLI